jgi:hypothetical protein
MSEVISEKKVQLAVKEGIQRGRRLRRARTMFIKQYVGHYYREQFGKEGDEPINLIFHVIRALVPNLVSRNPMSRVTTSMVEYKPYAYMLGMALDTLNDRLHIKNVIRRAVVDALFSMGIVKVGLSASDQLIEFGDMRVDPGQVYASYLDFDDFVADPTCTIFEENAAFLGHKSRVPRIMLLDDADCDHDIVKRLPRSAHPEAKKRASAISLQGTSTTEMEELQDYVDVVELYIPGADASVIVPDPEQFMSDRYIKMQEFYGPKTGPYHFLSLTQPVPGNPYPIAPVGIWYDLHIMANRLMRKQMIRADNQKTVIVADPSAADQAEEMRDAEDGSIIFGNPDSAQPVSTPGAEADSQAMLGQLQTWFNYVSGNPDQMAGIVSSASTATQATILEGNSTITIEDSRNMIYDFAASISSAEAWYLHYDPLIDLPLIARRPSRGEEMPEGVGVGQQFRLTPAQRRGEHFDFVFKIRPKSMSTLDPLAMAKRMMDFATNAVPALIMAASAAMQMGVQFNVQRAITDLAEQLELGDEVQDWFEDPEFMQKIQLMMAMGPQPEGKAGLKGVRQNGGYPGQVSFGGNSIQQNAQAIAGEPQSEMKGGLRGTPGSRGPAPSTGVFR